MEWMDSESSAQSGLVVTNETETPETVTVGCRTEEEVLFTETERLAPGESFEQSDLPDESFEVGVRVEEGPEAARRFDAGDESPSVTATLTDSEVVFGRENGVGFASGPDHAADEAAGADAETSGTEASGGGSGAAAAEADSSASSRTESSERTEPPSESSTDSDDYTLASDEVFCRSCGSPIKKRAEICPDCGVRNAAHDPTAGTSGGRSPAASNGGVQSTAATSASTQGTASQQSRQSEPSSVGRIGVMLGAGLWLLAIFILVPLTLLFQSGMSAGPGGGMGMMAQSLGLAALLPVVQILGWVVLPVSLYLDLRYIDYHVDDWPLNGRLYIAAAIILPVLTQILGAAALFMGGLGSIVAIIIPALLLWLSVRHLRTRSRVLD